MDHNYWIDMMQGSPVNRLFHPVKLITKGCVNLDEEANFRKVVVTLQRSDKRWINFLEMLNRAFNSLKLSSGFFHPILLFVVDFQ